jgi:hypothetical protein
MTAHLAGALGVPVWTLLPHECDWRWMLHRNDSPWYPTMRLFRQRKPGEWNAVVRPLVHSLNALTSHPPGNGIARVRSNDVIRLLQQE